MKLFSERFRPIFAAEGGEGAAASDAGSTPPASTPSGAADAAPAAAPTSPAEGGRANTSSDFSALGMPMDDDDVLIVPDTPASAPPPAPVAPEAPPATAQPAAQPPAAKPQEAPKAPEPTAAPPAAPAPQAAAVADNPEGLVTRLGEHREAIIDGLAAERFKLSQQEMDAVTADPASAVPRLLARAFFESTQASLLHLQNYVPKMVGQMMRDLKAHDEVESRFYGAHKPLEKAKHDADVRKFALAFRQANPKISEEELFPMVAYAVMAKHGLAAGAPTAQQPPATNGQARSAPPAPAFVPARPGVGGARVTVTQDEAPWMGLGRNYDED